MRLLFLTTSISAFLSIISAKAADFWLSERIAIIDSFAGLQYSLNPGIAWGIQLPSDLQEILIILALVLVAYLALKAEGQEFKILNLKFKIAPLAYGMILGGGLANIIDRLQDGFVTDYFQIGSFPIFNVADSFVTIGVVLLFIDSFLAKKE